MMTVDIDTIVNIINSCGVPVLCLIAMFKMWQEEQDKHKDEVDKLRSAVENNTAVMQSLISKLDSYK